MQCYEFVNFTPENICRKEGIGISTGVDFIMVGEQKVRLADEIVSGSRGVVYDTENFYLPHRLVTADGSFFGDELTLHPAQICANRVIVLCRIRRHGFHRLRYETERAIVCSRVFDANNPDHYEEELLATLAPGECIRVIRTKVARLGEGIVEYDRFENAIQFTDFSFPMCTPDYTSTRDELARRSH